MKISPIDIQQQQFKSRPFGYEKAGVDQFLEILADEMERLIRCNQDLQEELARATASLAEMRDREETLKETLVTTQRVTDELKSTARREVDVIMAEAEIKAERLMHNAEERRLQLIEEIQEIKRQKIDFEVSLRGLLEKHIRMIDLNTVAIEDQDAAAKLLEEPLPFETQQSLDSDACDDDPEETAEELVEDAEYSDSAGEERLDVELSDEIQSDEESIEPTEEKTVPDLAFDFDLNDNGNEEDLLK